MANKRLDEPTGTETVGHEWDGIEELDTPLPRWWLWSFYLSILFAIGYVIAYPALPMLSKATEGTLGWSSRGELANEMRLADEGRAEFRQMLASTPLEHLADDPALMQKAVAGGRAAFDVNCVQCHGSGAAGFEGYPNLNDDDWLWGGNLQEIEFTLIHGIREPAGGETRFNTMPAFGRDGIFDAAQLAAVTDHTLSFTGKAESSAEGAELYATNCAVCHAADGTGIRELGGPNLADAISLYGGTREKVLQQINAPRHGVMPAWGGRLDPVTIKMLAAFVHSRGGGEAFTDNAADTATEGPAIEDNEQP